MAMAVKFSGTQGAVTRPDLGRRFAAMKRAERNAIAVTGVRETDQITKTFCLPEG